LDSPEPVVRNDDVARGAGLAAVSRLGTLIELVSQPAFTWMYGWATFGIYTVLWACVNIIENIVDLSMTQGLQREVPAAPNAGVAAAMVRYALLITVIPAVILAIAISLCAHWIAPWFNAADRDLALLPTTIAIFAWALPLWTFIEVSTSAVRARRAFGPEIRLRIFWEQVLRLALAALLWAGGAGPLGLALAHILSLTLTAGLSARLLLRYYDARHLRTFPLAKDYRSSLLKSGLGTMPPALARRLFNDFPPVLLNVLLPGAAGANAAGFFGVARKIASVPLIVRQSFLYVLAPLTSEQAAQDRAFISPLYRFSVRLSVILAIPITALMILLSPDILRLFAPGAQAAVVLTFILLAARGVEAAIGPATPMIEMLGHRAMPSLTSMIGVGVAAILAFVLVPGGGAQGMAIAVAVGIMLMALIPVVQMHWAERIGMFDRLLLRVILCALAGSAILLGVGYVLQAMAPLARAILIMLMFCPIIWCIVRLGLPKADRIALGSLGRKLRLH
jgi:O-antigen/teichoic acid export membrane protein